MHKYIMTFDSFRNKMSVKRKRKKRIEAWIIAHPKTELEGEPVNPELYIPRDVV